MTENEMVITSLILDSITDSMDLTLGKLGEIVKDSEAWHVTVRRDAKGWT